MVTMIMNDLNLWTTNKGGDGFKICQNSSIQTLLFFYLEDTAILLSVETFHVNKEWVFKKGGNIVEPTFDIIKKPRSGCKLFCYLNFFGII